MSLFHLCLITDLMDSFSCPEEEEMFVGSPTGREEEDRSER
jgi:hypothetical protein